MRFFVTVNVKNWQRSYLFRGFYSRHIKIFFGHRRYNILGSVNHITKHMLTIENDTYITAIEVYEILRIISREYTGKTVHLVLDNAKYQKYDAIQDLAAELGIALQFVPFYSPTLT